MPTLDLPVDGEQPWGEKLRTAIEDVNVAVDDLVATRGAYTDINDQTGTTYAPVLDDDGALVTLTNSSAITVTLPSDGTLDFPIGHRIDFAGLGTGLVTFAAGSGATVNATPALTTRARYSMASAIKRAANTWLVVGDLA